MSARPTVSAVLIVKDEEAVLDACLTSVAWADEIVVYDTGSTDATVEIARRHTDVVVEGYWDDDFAAARNRALSHATGEWVLSIDADEVFEGDHQRMRELLGRGGATAHTILQRNLTDEADLPLQLAQRAREAVVTRVFRREVTRWRGALHEQPYDLRTGALAHVTSLPNVVLEHAGYREEIAAGKGKALRNYELALAQVEHARATALPPAEVEVLRVHLARAMIGAGFLDEALAEGDAMLAEGFVSTAYATILARSMVAAAALLQDRDSEERWLAAWEDNDSNPAFALAARARAAAARGDAVAASAALERVPTTVVDGLGARQDRIDLVTVEVWARATVGDRRRAGQVAVAAVAAGRAPGAPSGLVDLLDAGDLARVIDALPADLWREYVTWCAMDVTAGSRTFLRLMHDRRPGDGAVLGAVALLAPAMSLEEAAGWSVDMRRAGAAETCPLVRISGDPLLDPRQRALAGALAYSAYGDERGLAGLEDALAHVRAEDEVELLAELAIVAPGLVGAAA